MVERIRIVRTAKKYVGYLEHLTNELLGVFTQNVGKGGCTIFAYLIGTKYRWRNFSGLPWCATFVHSVFIEALGKETARTLLGKPHPGSRVLYRRFKRKRKLTDTPKEGYVVFLTNGNNRVDHCGIVVDVDGDKVITVEGNATDTTGIFEEHEGGAVAQRVRAMTDTAIVCYGKVGD